MKRPYPIKDPSQKWIADLHRNSKFPTREQIRQRLERLAITNQLQRPKNGISELSFNYLHFSQSINKINNRYKLTEYKQVLVFEAVLSAYAENVTLSVMDLILLREIASQSTLHSITKRLVYLQLIKIEISEIDARRKLVIPTKQGLSWLNDCSNVLASIAE